MKAKTLSAGVIVVRQQDGDWSYLLLRAYQYWDFPKGLVEPGEQPLQAAIREVDEETTLNDLVFRWGEDYRETLPYRNGKVARYYIAETKTSAIILPVSPELGRPEHDEYRWVNSSELRELTAVRLLPIIDWAEQLIHDTGPPSGHLLPELIQ